MIISNGKWEIIICFSLRSNVCITATDTDAMQNHERLLHILIMTILRRRRSSGLRIVTARRKQKVRTFKLTSVLRKLGSQSSGTWHIILKILSDNDKKKQKHNFGRKHDLKERKKSDLFSASQKVTSQKKQSFSCEICGRYLSTKGNLKRHRFLKHSK